MKVIKEGRDQKSWAKEFTCSGNGNGNGGCGAILLVEATDLYRTYSTDYGGGRDTYTTFECPICHVETDVKVPSNIPIRDKASKIDYTDK